MRSALASALLLAAATPAVGGAVEVQPARRHPDLTDGQAARTSGTGYLGKGWNRAGARKRARAQRKAKRKAQRAARKASR